MDMSHFPPYAGGGWGGYVCVSISVVASCCNVLRVEMGFGMNVVVSNFFVLNWLNW